MSDQPTDRPRARRRQRGPDTPPTETAAAGTPADEPVAASPEPGEEVVLSRTIFGFLEPVLDRIGTYAAPWLSPAWWRWWRALAW